MDSDEREDRHQLLQAIFEAYPDILTVSSVREGTFIEVNTAFTEQTGWPREAALGKSSLDLGLWAEPEERARFMALLADTGRVRSFEAAFRLKTGEFRRYQLSGSRTELGGEDALILIGRDITETHAAAERERKSAFLLERAEEMAKIGSWEFDYVTKVVTGSEGASRIYGVPRENLTVEDIETIPLPEYRSLLDTARDGQIRRGEPYDIEFKIRRRGDDAVLDVHSRALWDPKNKRLFGIIRDITDEKRAEAVLRAAIAERDLLIQELFHRINNTLQIVLSLLMLEAERADSEAMDALVHRMQRRVGAVASVHGSLYSARDISRISLREFLSRFLEELRRALDREADMELILDVGDVDLNIEAAVPCGIILAELVHNALVHGRAPGGGGRVRIAARRLDGQVEMRVSDDGPGLDVDPDALPRSWLGLRLAKLLAEGQLGGAIEFRNRPGLECLVRFDDDRLAARP